MGALAAAGMIAALSAGVSTAAAPTLVSSASNSKLGKILVNAHGQTLYMFSKDTHGVPTCSGSCASTWKPLLGGAVAAKSGAGLNSGLLKLASNGANKQASYNNHPLYTYSGDHGAGQTNGEGISSFGGKWYAVSTSGNEVAPKKSGSCNPVCTGY